MIIWLHDNKSETLEAFTCLHFLYITIPKLQRCIEIWELISDCSRNFSGQVIIWLHDNKSETLEAFTCLHFLYIVSSFDTGVAQVDAILSQKDKDLPTLHTVYPKKYAHLFVVLCFVVVMQSFIMNSHEIFIHIHQGCFAGTGAIVRLPQCQWSKPDGYGKISQCKTTTKHSKAKTVCIFLGIYCSQYHGCWWACDTGSQDIKDINSDKQSWYSIGQVCLKWVVG